MTQFHSKFIHIGYAVKQVSSEKVKFHLKTQEQQAMNTNSYIDIIFASVYRVCMHKTSNIAW